MGRMGRMGQEGELRDNKKGDGLAVGAGAEFLADGAGVDVDGLGGAVELFRDFLGDESGDEETDDRGLARGKGAALAHARGTVAGVFSHRDHRWRRWLSWMPRSRSRGSKMAR